MHVLYVLHLFHMLYLLHLLHVLHVFHVLHVLHVFHVQLSQTNTLDKCHPSLIRLKVGLGSVEQSMEPENTTMGQIHHTKPSV